MRTSQTRVRRGGGKRAQTRSDQDREHDAADDDRLDQGQVPVPQRQSVHRDATLTEDQANQPPRPAYQPGKEPFASRLLAGRAVL